MARTRAKPDPDPMPQCCSCGSSLNWTTPDEAEPDARLGRCPRKECGEWIAADKRGDRWMITGRLRGPVRRPGSAQPLPASAAR